MFVLCVISIRIVTRYVFVQDNFQKKIKIKQQVQLQHIYSADVQFNVM